MARRGILVLLVYTCAVAFGTVLDAKAQQEEAKPKALMFSGTVTTVDSSSLTVIRAGDGKVPGTHTFAITAETTFEGGKPKVASRVTVRYVEAEDGDRAVHVIVRPAARK